MDFYKALVVSLSTQEGVQKDETDERALNSDRGSCGPEPPENQQADCDSGWRIVSVRKPSSTRKLRMSRIHDKSRKVAGEQTQASTSRPRDY